ncbi:MAG TPA: Rieske 2Fe-2S domain-containing protein [Candidatus Bathyarchaeia archaeon]|nr:Rieske 2Fe-2S domain-containing protein [Candidatus Bathyarchaeia archaeon]
MGQYERHVFVCTSGETCPMQGDVEAYVKKLRESVQKAGKQTEVRINKSGCFSQCGHGPMIVFYPDDVWYTGVQASDLDEIFTSHVLGGRPVERLRYNPGKPGANKVDVPKKPAAAAAPSSAWRPVCRVDEVPDGGLKQFRVDHTDVVIANAGGKLFACQALCPHEAVALADGVHDGSTLTCLEHMWQFDLATGAPQGDATCGLTMYPLKHEGVQVYIDLG